MVITSVLWTIIEFVVLVLLFLKTEYYKKLKNLCETKENSTFDNFFIKKRKIIRVTAIISFTILAPICNILLFQDVTNVCMAIRFFIAYCLLSVVSITDFKKHIIPNNILIVVVILRVILFLPEYFYCKDDYKSLILNSFIGLIGLFVVLLILSVISKGGFGMGDVKLFSVLGFLCGIYFTFNVLLFSLILCSLFSLVLLCIKSKNLKDKLAFGPFIYLGFIISIALSTM